MKDQYMPYEQAYENKHMDALKTSSSRIQTYTFE